MSCLKLSLYSGEGAVSKSRVSRVAGLQLTEWEAAFWSVFVEVYLKMTFPEYFHTALDGILPNSSCGELFVTDI